MGNDGYRFSMTPLCAALALLFASSVSAEEISSASPKVVIPRMVTQQGSLNAAQGGQITLITSNGVLQGPAASMLQVIAPQAATAATPPGTHASIIASVIRQMPLGPANLPATGAAGLATPAPAASFPNQPSVVAGSAVFPGALAVNASAPPNINWQTFTIGQGSAAQFAQPNAPSAVFHGVTGGLPLSIRGNLISNGQVFSVSPNAVALNVTGIGTGATTLTSAGGIAVGAGLINLNSGTSAVRAGAVTLTGAGGIGVGGAVGLSVAKPPGVVTVR